MITKRWTPEKWKDYYKDLDIPESWENTSYGNDELPSFQYNKWLIWIDEPNEEVRKEKWGSEQQRFVIILEEHYGTSEGEEFTTNDFNKVINYVGEK